MQEQKWITEAKKYIGLKEIKGKEHNPEILKFWKDIDSDWFKDDETPWCAGFVGAVLQRVGIESTKNAGAKSYLKWGVELKHPHEGAIVIFSRNGGGHVGFVVGVDEHDRLMVLGGNQGDAVNIKPFSKDRVVGYRWPKGYDLPKGVISLMASGGAVESSNEA